MSGSLPATVAFAHTIRVIFLITALCATSALAQAQPLRVGWQSVDGVDIFYREAGREDAPVIVFLHGSPASSLQYEAVMQGLADGGTHRVIAMDYPSYGFSAAPTREAYRYTFDNLAATVGQFLRIKRVERYTLFMQDYGVPIGFRLISAAPQAITGIIVQNGVIHLDGFPAAQDENGELRRHWKNRNPRVDQRRRDYAATMKFPQAAGWEYPPTTSPDFVLLNMVSAQRPGVIEARNDLWFDYRSNLERYPQWQATLRSMRVPVLVLWGGRDDFFTAPGALAYLRDAPHAEVHILDADHFATLDVPDEVIRLTADFLDRHAAKPAAERSAGE